MKVFFISKLIITLYTQLLQWPVEEKNFLKVARDALSLSSADKCQESASAYALYNYSYVISLTQILTAWIYQYRILQIVRNCKHRMNNEL